MNVLLIMPYGSVGGMERLAFTFYNHYKSLGYKVKAVKLIKLETDIINFGEDEYYFSDVDFAGMSKVNRALFYLKAPLKLRKIIKDEKITHSISFGDMTNLFSSLTYTKEFKIASIHALKSVEFSNQTMFNKIFKFSYRTSYKNFNKVVCISKAIKEDIIAKCGYKFDNLQIIYNPHDIKEINRLSELPIDQPSEVEIFSKDVIIFVGRLSVQKAPWHLINAFSKLLTEKDNVNLVFVGDGDSRVVEYIKDQIQSLNINDKIFMLGRKSNPYKYIKSAKVLALSSYYEGTPNVIVESVCIGTPIVSTNCTGGIIELMSNVKKDEVGNNVVTESGFITPNIFKGKLEIPSENRFIEEEEDMKDALFQILSSNSFKTQLKEERDALLLKFDLETVASQYLLI